MLNVPTTDILEFDVLQIPPDPFLRIEFRCITRQLHQAQALRRSVGEILLDRLAAMDGSPIPNDPQLARDLLLQTLQKLDAVLPLEGALQRHGVELALGSDPSD